MLIPRSALILLETNKAWRHILSESSTSTHRQVVITQLAYERDDPPFVIQIIPFLLLFISLPAFYLTSIHRSCSVLFHRSRSQLLHISVSCSSSLYNVMEHTPSQRARPES